MPTILGPRPQVVDFPISGRQQRVLSMLSAYAFPRVEVLQDNFNASSLDTTKWLFDNHFDPPNAAFNSAGNMSQTGDGFVKLFATDTTAFNDVSELKSQLFDLRGSSIYVNLNLSSIAGTGEVDMEFCLRDGAPDGDPVNNTIAFIIDQTGASTQDFQRFVKKKTGNFFDDTTAPTTWTFATCAWLRLRENGGTIFFDRAPSTASNPPIEADWLNIVSTASTDVNFDIWRVRVGLRRSTQGGTLTNASDGTVSIDSVNTKTGVAGSIFNDTITETATPADSPVGGLSVGGVLAETATPTDVEAAVTARAGALAETATPVETESSLAVQGVAITESATVTTAVSAGTIQAVAITEAATPADTTSSVIAKTGAIIDTSSPSEALDATISNIYQVSIGESLILSEIFGVLGWFPLDSSQASTWAGVGTTQTPGWSAVSTTDDPGWTKTP